MRDFDEDLIRNITPAVLQVLKNRRYFASLDDQMCPKDPASPPRECRGHHELSVSILQDLHFDAQEIEEIIDVLKSNGGGCDCEVLYNIAEESRLKEEYWKGKSAKILTKHPARGRQD